MKKNLDYMNQKRNKKEKITMLSCYDYPTSMLAEKAGIDIVLVGDSVGVKMLGYESLNEVTMEDMIHHLKAVRRAIKVSYLMVDMPNCSYKTATEAIKNAKIFSEYGADGVKIEVFERN